MILKRLWGRLISMNEECKWSFCGHTVEWIWCPENRLSSVMWKMDGGTEERKVAHNEQVGRG
jgi:hypothetical protein